MTATPRPHPFPSRPSLWRRFRYRWNRAALVISPLFVLVPIFGWIPRVRLMMARGALVGLVLMSPLTIMTILAIIADHFGLA
ncbi:hypothetical protein [Rothia kristinae]|uniref:hypothetical protein n=1 Tax=Rothia kristinae TaxID=37923 RepID=UPI0011A1FA03|nr:hypothetical protein [Rothia kristinae]